MTLTEQWQKGELKAGYYYVKNEFGNIFPSDYSEEYDCLTDSGVLGFWNEVSEIVEVLAKVPTYEEYQALLKDKELWIKRCNNARNHQFNAMKEAKTLAQTLLKVSPEHKAWLEKNYKEYL